MTKFTGQRCKLFSQCFVYMLNFIIHNNRYGVHNIKFSQKNINNKEKLRASLFSYRPISKASPLNSYILQLERKETSAGLVASTTAKYHVILI